MPIGNLLAVITLLLGGHGYRKGLPGRSAGVEHGHPHIRVFRPLSARAPGP